MFSQSIFFKIYCKKNNVFILSANIRYKHTNNI
nr:MAG TPA: hypothetical protein [Caudoviricetes sp.]